MCKTPHVLALIASFFGLVAQAAPRPSDLVQPQKRQVAVAIAQQLARAPSADTLPMDLANPFNPTDFAGQQRQAAAATSSATQILLPPTDEETLQLLVSLIPSAATMSHQGKQVLIIGGRPIGIGQVLTVPYKNQDYDLEITAITETTFTLRYGDAELTRLKVRAAK